VVDVHARGVADAKVCSLGQLRSTKGKCKSAGFYFPAPFLLEDSREGNGEGCVREMGGFQVQLLPCRGRDLATENDEKVFAPDTVRFLWKTPILFF